MPSRPEGCWTGWLVESEGNPIRTASNYNLSVTTDIDWFELDGSVAGDLRQGRAAAPRARQAPSSALNIAVA